MAVDDLERSLNAEVAKTLVRLFEDGRINRKGGTLIFSAHSPEMLDEFDRRDCIFVARNHNGISADCLCNFPCSGDIIKSEAYRSSFFGGTAPSYESYLQLRKSLCMR